MAVYWASSAGIITSAGSGLVSELKVCQLAMTWLGADPDSLSNVATVTNNSTKEEVLCNVVYSSARKAVLKDYNWGFAKKHFMLNPADGYAESYFNNQSIASISQADPAVVTFNNNHGFLDGWLVRISNCAGMTQINNRVVTVANNNGLGFETYGLSTVQFNAYTGGGTAIRYEAYSNYQKGYAFDVPPDFLKAIQIEGRPQYEVIGSGNTQRILCTEQYPIIEYIADITTVSDMSEEFKRAWAARIAAELANPLQKTNAAMPDMWQYYQQVLEREAKPADSPNLDPKYLIQEKSSVLSEGGWE